jgi:hypothetical protein
VVSGTKGKTVAVRVAWYWVCVALSIALCIRIALAMKCARGVLWTALALFAGWLTADFVGAVYHWYMDNYSKRPNGFLRHHCEPAALAEQTLRMNVRGTALPVAALLAGAVVLPGEPSAAFLLTLLNGVLHTEHAHSLAHAPAAEVSRVVLMMQSVPGLPLLIPPAVHHWHHVRPVGKVAYGGLNGWSNYLTDTTRFFRALEAMCERLTGRTPAWRNAVAAR